MLKPLVQLTKSISKTLNQDVPFLLVAKDRLFLIGFVALYSLIFILVYSPFNIDQWGSDHYFDYIFAGTTVLLVSQFGLRPLFNFYRFKMYSLLLWCLIEILVLACIFYLLFGPEYPNLKEKINEYFLTLQYTGLVAGIPYAFFLWYMTLRRKMTSLKESSNDGNAEFAPRENKLLTINGENGKVTLAIRHHQLLYVKSASNYIELFYLKGEKLTKELIRGSSKEFEGKVLGSDILRIHRSYFINIRYVSSFKKTRKGYALTINHVPNETIPVSTSYKHIFEEILEQKLHH